MRAVVCSQWSGPEGLKVGELPDPPPPGEGEVRVRVAAAGINFADTLMIQGKYQEKPPFPFAPGLEVAGEIEALGAGLGNGAGDGLHVGQRVLALTDSGGFAELATARASDVFPIPSTMDYTTAAGFPITYGTAHGALVWRAATQPGETVLVNGAAGGVGLAAVEVAKALGATVIASAGGPDKLAVARAHGADHLVDARAEDLRARVKELTGQRGVDVVFDPVGGTVFEASMRATAWSGRLLIIGFAAGDVPQIPANILLVKNLSALGLYWGSYRKQAPRRLALAFEELFGWFEAGKLKPLVSETFDLARAPEAMQRLLDRKSTGKLVLTTGAA